STPSSAAAGAASISPIGPNINEPSASYELTRDSDSGGISRCMVVIHSTPNTSKQTPSTNAPATVTQSGAPAPSRKYGSAAGRQSSAPTRIGRRGRTRSDTTTPALVPIASPARNAGHAAGPPRLSLASSGPSTP